MAAATMNTDVEAVDFDSDDDDLMDEEGAIEPSPAPAPRLRSTIAGGGGGGDDGPLKTKGRGFREDPNSFSAPRDSRLVGVSRAGFDALASDGGPGPVRSIEGWIVLVTGIHEEAQEDDLHNIFGNFGQVKNLHLNLDRRTGFVKGYALIEYENFEEAQAAIKASDGTELLTQIISVDWAFSNGPVKRRNTRKRFSRIGANSTPSSPPPTTPPTNGKRGNSKKPPTDGTSSPSSSGAGDVLRLMDALRVEPDEDVYISLLRDSANAAEVAAVHAHIAGKRAAFGLSLPLANRLLLAYASCGDRAAARKVFDEMPVKNGITWATMVSTYSDGCFHSEAIWLFTCMCHEARDLGGDCYDHAIVPVLRSCARVSEPRLGEQVHALVIKKNGVRGDIGSSLLQLYCESSLHSRARRVLDMMRCSCEEPVPEAAWTSFITACHRDGLLDEAIDVFRDMVSFGVARSSFSLSSILAVCAESENQGCHGQQAHADAIKHGVNTNQFVMSGLVHMYAKQGQLANAARVFDTVGSQRDGVCWNTMALAYARSGWYREATRVMYRMKAAGVKPSELTINEVRLAYSR